jgi:DMSO/TMAO reductase YedYZ molybdopterin-dependent catalytic subunit
LALEPDAAVTHVVVGGLDGYRSVIRIDDALAPNVLIADHLDGRPLDGDHGAPARLVSPSQYGYVSVKHLCWIELHLAEHSAKAAAAQAIGGGRLASILFSRHPRARVWEEERNGDLPNRLVRPVYRLLTPAFASLSSRGRRRR